MHRIHYIMSERVSHPEITIHRSFLENLGRLKQNIATSQVDIADILYNFFSQFIKATCTDFNDVFKAIVHRAIYNDYSHMPPREMAAHIIKSETVDLIWPDHFMCGTNPRLYLSDLRNQIVFVLWSQHRHMIDPQWLPESNPDGTVTQQEDYRKAAHHIGGRMVDPRDSERLWSLLSWTHYLKMIHFVKAYVEMEDDIDMPIDVLNTCSGSWLHAYNQHGMQRVVWEQFLNLWHYDKNS